MIWICFVLIFIFDIYFLIYLKHCNDELRQEVKATREWCNDLMSKLANQEKKISELLNKVVHDIYEDKK